MTKSEHIREQYSQGVSRAELVEEYGHSLVSHALRVAPATRPQGRPRDPQRARCEHCGQPMPRVTAHA